MGDTVFGLYKLQLYVGRVNSFNVATNHMIRMLKWRGRGSRSSLHSPSKPQSPPQCEAR